ncbi:hypothetical protein G6F57_012805 [Rhizopus arrhizus]|uniref:Uncharacterized protein n=1 Tax=Rhizopus oryzae TaxID=64495 RepID=A0A9P6X192_RHIOR|nr:hypothetical protein G6F23_010885 [Rhizopus arrhizus]KAG1415233.1 hypothetical protein G6F58_006574 [Rhizopus delemar]KAG0754784.1 hypothetical protein G6F24_012256 [Rhizopus arrhizus]KAG0781471.1 hypothetical protein G6F22_009552 [Rhizopus arrhizus]KAG0783646.1 hypothetical protein G6F21_010412 [Rhizopus arrhizus]
MQQYDWNGKDIIEEIEDIDPTCNEHLDGEPMNELELLAAKNAIINSKLAKVVYENNPIIEPESPKTQESLKESIVNISDDSSNSNNGSNINSSNAPENVTKNNNTTQKKKKWPFSFLFKKQQANNTISNYESHRSATIISSGPPTPILSPANSSSASSSPSPFHPQNNAAQGVWAFRTPFMAYWVRFDAVNQQKITNHVYSHNPDILYLIDSHLCAGQLPVLVLPFQGLCYYALDFAVSQVGCLQLAYLPNDNRASLPVHLA